MNTGTIEAKGQNSERESHEPLTVAAEHPDAAPTPADNATRVVLHVLALVGLVALVVYCVAGGV